MKAAPEGAPQKMEGRASSPTLPLEGVRVLDLTTVIMGPYASHILADLGADVIKIESPEGDLIRHYHPHRSEGMSGVFLNLHRNKRSIVLDLKREPDRAAFTRLLATADVFLHNLRPGPISRLGFDYERVSALNPRLIYCAARGFSERGPYRDKAAYDDLIQAGSGIAALFTSLSGEPAYVPTVLCDKLAAQAIVYAILAALFARERDGKGRAIEVPMFETAIAFTLVEHDTGSAFIPPLGPAGFGRLLNPRRKPYRTRNGYACILPYTDRNWLDFYEFTGRREFVGDPRFERLAERVKHIDVLYAMIEEEAPKRTTEEWVAFCDRVSIPCMPVLSLDDLPYDPHLQAIGFFTEAEHPSEGRYRLIADPVRFSDTPSFLRRHAPRLGEHTEEVLREAGVDEALLAAVLARPKEEDRPERGSV
jgi:crotonobetainyl-CoA:carnitine CoA-transferase CaiB-like acyl-CoA transferase